MPLKSILHLNRNVLSKEYSPRRMWHCGKTGDRGLGTDHHFYLYEANGKVLRVNWLVLTEEHLQCISWEARHVAVPTGESRRALYLVK